MSASEQQPRRSEGRPRAVALRRAVVGRGEAGFRTFVARAEPGRIERTIGSPLGLRLVFAAMAARFDPSRSGGFAGDIRYELRYEDGRERTWTVRCAAEGARAVAGERPAPRVTIRVGVADFARIATGELDPGIALLRRRLDIAGDFLVAARLGAMFRAPSPG